MLKLKKVRKKFGGLGFLSNFAEIYKMFNLHLRLKLRQNMPKLRLKGA